MGFYAAHKFIGARSVWRPASGKTTAHSPFRDDGFLCSQKALPNEFANPAQNVVLKRCRLVYFLPAVWRVDSLSIEADDFDYAPFSQRGGLGRAHQLFGNDLNLILDELNLRLVA
jgi:hypothetical protein